MRDGGKGDKQRPLTVPEEQFNKNWDEIFKRPAKQQYESEYLKNVKLAAQAREEG